MDTSPSHSRLAYRPDIDGLRAVAVLSVLFGHVGLGFPGGYVGVDVFFVISGYLITSLILKDLRRGKFSLAEFWERRIRRIFPALFAVTLATLIAGWFLLFPDAYGDLARSVLALISMVSNFYFWRTTGYFETAAEEKPLLHTWSLAVEEQFYLLVPIFLIYLAKTNRLQRAFPILVTVMIASFALSVYGVAKGLGATFYLLPSRAWELLAGVYLAFVAERGEKGPGKLADPLAFLGLFAILVPCVLYNETTPFPGLAAAPPVLGAVLLIWCGMEQRMPFINRLLASGPVVFVGMISYSLYLWHWPLLVFVKSQFILPLSVEMKLAVIAGSLLLAIASWRFVETPFRKRQILAPTRTLVWAASFSFLGLFGTGMLLSMFKGIESRIPETARTYAEAARVDPRTMHQLEARDVPSQLPVLGNRGGPPSFLIWGDSHAMTLLPVLTALCEEYGVTGVVATHSSTPPALDYVPPMGLGKDAIAFNQAVFQYIRSQGLKTVVLSARWDQYFKDPRFSTALQRTVADLQRNNVRTYLVTDFEFPYDVPKALALYSWRGWDFARLGLPTDLCTAQRQRYSALFAGFAQEGVTVLDPIPIFQARTRTSKIQPYDAGGSFYRDRHHFSTYGSLALKPLFSPLFADLPHGRPARQARTPSEQVVRQ